MKRDFLKLTDLSRDELYLLLDRSQELKRLNKQGREPKPLAGKTLAMIFEKRSTRTRLSFETGIHQLGGFSIFMSPEQMQLSRGEPIQDTARVLSRYVDGVIIRNDSHRQLLEFARCATVPVLNALSDIHHPCQVLSDLFTIREAGLNIDKMKLAYIGDPNNVFNSWLDASAMLGFELRLASPKGYKPDPLVLKAAAKAGKVSFRHYPKPQSAAKGADVLYTDVWVSMGQEAAAKEKIAAFRGFQLNEKILAAVGKKPLVMHCLPAHRGQEITDQLMEKYAELIFTQAENRLHCQKAILEFFVSGNKP